MASPVLIGHPVKVRAARLKDRKAEEVCNFLLQEAIIQIRGTAYLQRSVGRSVGEVDFSEEIRRLADLCDGLAGPRGGAAERLGYRFRVLSNEQAGWVRETLLAHGYVVPDDLNSSRTGGVPYSSLRPQPNSRGNLAGVRKLRRPPAAGKDASPVVPMSVDGPAKPALCAHIGASGAHSDPLTKNAVAGPNLTR